MLEGSSAERHEGGCESILILAEPFEAKYLLIDKNGKILFLMCNCPVSRFYFYRLNNNV